MKRLAFRSFHPSIRTVLLHRTMTDNTTILEETLGDMVPEEILYEFDCIPRIYTTKSPNGDLLLFYACEELDNGTIRYLVTRTTPETIQALKDGTLEVRQAILRHVNMYAVDMGKETTVYGICKMDIPDDVLPPRGVTLYQKGRGDSGRLVKRKRT